MIMRHWSGATTKENAKAYLDHLRQDTFPKLKGIEGFVEAQVLSRDHDGDVEFIVLTKWRSMEAIHKFAGENPNVAVVPDAARAVLKSYDTKVRHYNVALDAGIK